MTKTNTTNNYNLEDLIELLKDSKSDYNYWLNCYEEAESDGIKKFAQLKVDVIKNEINYIKELILNCENF